VGSQGYPARVMTDTQAEPRAPQRAPAELTAIAETPLIAGKSVIHHEDARTLVAAAIPPRTVPWRQRCFWWLLLWVLRSRIGRRWIAARYGE
jgi:hypothetical protein